MVEVGTEERWGQRESMPENWGGGGEKGIDREELGDKGRSLGGIKKSIGLLL